METLDAFFPRKEYVEMRQVYPVESDWFEVPITYQPSNRVVTRPYGSMPFVRPAPHDQSWLEEKKICDEDTSDYYLLCYALYNAGGHYVGDGSWDKFMKDLDLLRRRDWQGEAKRRELKLLAQSMQYKVVPNKDGKSKIRMD
jgi:hypothetical protein